MIEETVKIEDILSKIDALNAAIFVVHLNDGSSHRVISAANNLVSLRQKKDGRNAVYSFLTDNGNVVIKHKDIKEITGDNEDNLNKSFSIAGFDATAFHAVTMEK